MPLFLLMLPPCLYYFCLSNSAHLTKLRWTSIIVPIAFVAFFFNTVFQQKIGSGLPKHTVKSENSESEPGKMNKTREIRSQICRPCVVTKVELYFFFSIFDLSNTHIFLGKNIFQEKVKVLSPFLSNGTSINSLMYILLVVFFGGGIESIICSDARKSDK